VRLTGRGAGLLVAAVLLYAAGEVLGYAFLRALGGAAAGALLAALAAAARPARVTVSRELYPDRVECGQPALARLQVGNPAAARHPAFTAKDLVGDTHVEVGVRPLTAHASATYHYQLPTSRRGRVTVGPLALERRDPLGLARRRMSAGDALTLWVHPRRHPVWPASLGWPRHHHEGAALAAPLHGSTDLRSIREYTVGDELRHVHWKAMARTGSLMVREYVDPAQPRFTVLIDNRAGILPAAAFEAAVEVAASLVFAAAEAGHRTRLRTTGGLDRDTAGGLLAAREMLDRLCELGQGSAGPPVAPTRGGGGGGDAIVFVSGGSATSDAALLAGLGAPDARLTVIDVCPQDGHRPPGGVRIIRAATAAEAVQAWNLRAVR